jgi:hypothetical protein
VGVMYQIFFGKKIVLGGTFLERVDIFFQKNGWVLGWGGGNRVAVGPLNFLGKKKEKRIFLPKKMFQCRSYHCFPKKMDKF